MSDNFLISEEFMKSAIMKDHLFYIMTGIRVGKVKEEWEEHLKNIGYTDSNPNMHKKSNTIHLKLGKD